MSYFDDPTHVAEYVKMAEGYDGSDLVAQLRKHLAAGSTVLELGMGPGKDLALLADAGFAVTGSDSAQPFLDHYHAQGGTAPTRCLDARTLEIEESFDAIYSNKVLQHLSVEDLRTSLKRQRELLGEGGLMFHSFWHGEGSEEHHGLLFTYYTPESLRAATPEGLVEVASGRYAEMEQGDSLWVLWRVE